MSNQFNNGGQFPNGNFYAQQQQFPNGVAGMTQQFQNMGMNGAAKPADQFGQPQQQFYEQQQQADPNQQYYYDQQGQQWQSNQYPDPNAANQQQYPPSAADNQQYYDQNQQYYDQNGQPIAQNGQQYYQGTGGISQSPSADSLYQTPNMRAGGFSQQDGLDAPQPGTLSASSSQQKLPQQSPKPAQRIDPKQIPRTETERPSEQITRYMTCSGLVPPPSTSNFVVVDEGNCSPRFVRMTTYQVASDEDLVDQTKLVIGALIQPLADLGNDEEEIHVVDCGPAGPVRCTRCRAYINPFFKFIAEGAKFICALCGHENAVPEHYRCNLDPNGFRRDRFSRPELCRGTVEFVAPPEFIVRPIQDPCYLFVLDVSYSAVVSGFLRSAIDAIRVSLDGLANNPRARVGFITYNSSVQFYAIKPPRKAPQMYVVADVDEVFAPVPPDDLLVRPSDPAARALIDALLAMIPDMYESNRIQGCALGASVQGALETLRTLGGKVILTQSNLPQVGVGALESRDDVKLYYTEQEKNLFVPQTSFYERIATECAEQAITVDLFVAANSYVDVATVGALSSFTGGQVYFYEGFNQNKDGQALVADIWHDLTRRTGFDAVMVVRSSDNLKIHETYGNFFRRRPHEIELPSIDCDKTFGITLKHDGKLSDKTPACIQTALAYTTAEGQRRIRIHTISLPVTTTMANIFRYADLDAVLALSLKQACKQILHTTTPAKVRQALVTACIDSLFTYRKFCAQSTSPGQLILPESLKLLPLSTLGMIKHPLFHNGQRSDERAFLFNFVASMPTYVAVPFICPRLFSLADIPAESCIPDSTGRVFLPPCQSLSSDSIKPEGLYLLDDGRYLTVWIGDQLHPEIFREVFDIDPAVSGYHPSQLAFTERHNENPGHLATRILMLLYQLRKRKPNFPNLSFIARKQPSHHQDPMMAKALSAETLDESQFFKHLLEDAGGLQSYNVMTEDGDVKKGKDGAKDPSMMSYIDFLCHIHKRIQDKFY